MVSRNSGALFAFDPARQHRRRRADCSGISTEIAAGQTDKSGEGGAFGAAFVLVDLDDQFLAFAQCVLDTGAGDVHTGL